MVMEGPVEVVLEDGTVVRSDRPVVALCTCRRSLLYPWCDTSHRGPRRAAATRDRAPRPGSPGAEPSGGGPREPRAGGHGASADGHGGERRRSQGRAQ
ncbi:CDGSH iron-sulfur domain-containing protein [Streptomyces sp. LX-29]|uniref:CDGSH iron-sulfur domain-containing protein n=1 Tax=Streptomyces sp. LX-29 TaxID=2900152 RepID=UPI00240D0F2F|nr:CDGSH iron-sulfur domain-containing protein [Streptomyces sp. LX-29]WFB11421.1 CDGSH iron-sulfur domain-containing protein [Streptomyces sp. LX-29]